MFCPLAQQKIEVVFSWLNSKYGEAIKFKWNSGYVDKYFWYVYGVRLRIISTIQLLKKKKNVFSLFNVVEPQT